MYQAKVGDTIIAESESCHEVEGNIYFPPDSIKKEFLKPSTNKTICSWKGEASYFSVRVGEQELADAAWYYPNPKDEAMNIKNFVAFWNGVEVIKQTAKTA